MLWKFKQENMQLLWSRCYQQVRNWFTKFCSKDLSLEGKPRCSSEINKDALKTLVKNDSHLNTWKLAEKLNTLQPTICHHLKKMSKVSKFLYI